MKSEKIIIKVGLGFEMQGTARIFEPKGWLYLDFGKGSKLCIDLHSGEIIKGQSHCAPVLCPGERERLIALFANRLVVGG